MRRAGVAVLAVVVGFACGDSGTQPTPDYSLTLTPPALTIVQGANANTLVNIARTNFTGAVTFSLGNVPAGVTGVFAPVPATGTGAALTVSVEASVVAGVYTLSVDGTGTAGNRSTPLTLTVTAVGDYILSVSPTALTILPGANGTATVTIARTDFTGAVPLSLGNAPSGVTGSFSPPAPTGGSSLLTVNVGATTPGNYNLNVNGSGAPGNRSTPLALTVRDPCLVFADISADTTVTTGVLTSFDCAVFVGSAGPFFTDFYRFTLPAQAGLQITMTATYDTYLEKFHNNGAFISFSDDIDSANTNSRINIIAGAGTFVLAPSTFAGSITGPYTLDIAPRTYTQAGCRNENFLPWLTRGVAFAEQVQSTDCTTIRAGGGRGYGDRALIVLTPTRTLSASLSSAAFNPRLELYELPQTGGVVFRGAADGVSGTATLNYTPTAGGIFRLEMTSVDTVQTGAYTVTVGGPAPNVAEVITLPLPASSALPHGRAPKRR